MNVAAWVLITLFALRPLSDAFKLTARSRATTEQVAASMRQARSASYVASYMALSVLIAAGAVLLLLRAVGVL